MDGIGAYLLALKNHYLGATKAFIVVANGHETEFPVLEHARKEKPVFER
jgi:hypothetical protein